jgi:hypothetical protein
LLAVGVAATGEGDPRFISLAMASLYPDLQVGVDYELADFQDGEGPRISFWHRADIPQPTKEQIEAVDTAPLFRDRTPVLPQELMKLLTVDDVIKIQSAIASSPQLWLLWYSMMAQKDPMFFGNERFQAGWVALGQVLGADRIAQIAVRLGINL